MAFYSAALSAYSESDRDAVFCHTGDSPGQGKIEVTFQLGSQFLPATGDKKIALWTHSGGFLAKTQVVLQFTFAFRDVSNTDNTVIFNAGTNDVDVAVDLSDFATVTNTCPNPANIATSCTSGNQSLALHKCFDIQAVTGLQLAYDSPTRPGYTRRLATKGFRGFFFRDKSTKSTTITVNSVEYKSQKAIMLQMDPSTNCFPGQENGCRASEGSSNPSLVWAFGGAQSDQIQCSHGPWPGTPCDKVFRADAPLRVLLLAQFTAEKQYNPSSKIWNNTGNGNVLYTQHGAQSQGIEVANSAKCFPFPNCGSNNAAGGGLAPGAIAAISVFGVVAVAAAVIAIVYVTHLHHHIGSALKNRAKRIATTVTTPEARDLALGGVRSSTFI